MTNFTYKRVSDLMYRVAIASFYVLFSALSAVLFGGFFVMIVFAIFGNQVTETIGEWIYGTVAIAIFIFMIARGIKKTRKAKKKPVVIDTKKTTENKNKRNQMDETNKDSPENSVEVEVIQPKQQACNVLDIVNDATVTKTPYQNYKSKKKRRKTKENLQDSTEMLDAYTEATKSAVDTAKAQTDLIKHETTRNRIVEVENMKNDAKVSKLRALKTRYDVETAKNVVTINKLTNPPSPPPPPPPSKSRAERKAEEKINKEAEAARREAEVKKWRKELSEDPHFANEDIETEIERRKRERGWLDSI